jgi:hypothetical protein
MCTGRSSPALRRAPANSTRAGTSLHGFACAGEATVTAMSARRDIRDFWLAFVIASFVAVGCMEVQSVLPSLRTNGSRECAPDDRLREAIHLSTRCGMDCFVAPAQNLLRNFVASSSQ